MKRLLLASMAILTLGAAPVLAQGDTGAVVGGTAGGVSGAVAGGLIFGPIGAIIRGFTGAVIGASVVSDASVEYVRMHPTEPVVIEGDEVLLEWALEVLVKNGLDALAGRGGRMYLTTKRLDPGRPTYLEPTKGVAVYHWSVGLAQRAADTASQAVECGSPGWDAAVQRDTPRQTTRARRPIFACLLRVPLEDP